MKALIWGSNTEPLTVEKVCLLLDWIINNKYFIIDIDTYLSNMDHFNCEYSSIFLLQNCVYVAL